MLQHSLSSSYVTSEKGGVLLIMCSKKKFNDAIEREQLLSELQEEVRQFGIEILCSPEPASSDAKRIAIRMFHRGCNLIAQLQR